MIFKKLRLYKEEEGSAVILFIGCFFIIIGMLGLVIDGGILYKTKSELRKTANAAVLSGAQELKTSDALVEQITKETLVKNGEEASLKELLIRPNNESKVTVTLERVVPTNFLKILGIDTVPISISSSAAIVPLVRASGAVPLGIDKSQKLEFMKEYELKVDSGSSVSGNFGILALSGVGANLYEQDLMNGYDSDIEIGDVIGTQTGNVEGKTRNAVNYRISSSPYLTNDVTHRDDPRIIMILIYEPYQSATNQLQSVKICGFAYFYLKEPMNVHDSSIKGYFIERIGAGGTGNANAVNTGAYAIRLVE
jgi:hypothetical protein